MGCYGMVYDCGDGCYCTSEFWTLTSDWSNCYKPCKKHELKKGNTFNYCFRKFIEKFGKSPDNHNITYLPCEIIDFKQNYKGQMLVRMKTTYDCFLLNKSKNIIFSEFNDCYAFEKLDDGKCILTYFFVEDDIERFVAKNANYDYMNGGFIIKNDNNNDNNNI